jgi:membrane protease YdiL (CAAX protease family)
VSEHPKDRGVVLLYAAEVAPFPAPPGTAPARSAPAFGAADIHLRALPIVLTLVLGISVALSGVLLGRATARAVVPELVARHDWVTAWAGHLGQLAVGFLAIALLRRRVPGTYGLQRPVGKSYVGAAIGWGVAFGVIMTIVDFAPHLAARQPPPGPFALTASNLAGWLGFEWIMAGAAEEVVFRGLLVTFLASQVSGRVRLFGRELHVAGVIIAILFAVAHATNFAHRPFFAALGQQLYAAALAILYAYWLERSRSLAAPIIGHNVANGVEYTIAFALQAAWG